MTFDDNDFVPVTGRDLAIGHVRTESFAIHDIKTTSEIDRHIVRLLALHPDIALKFRYPGLATLNDQTKRLLLQDMNELLGIRTLKKYP